MGSEDKALFIRFKDQIPTAKPVMEAMFQMFKDMELKTPVTDKHVDGDDDMGMSEAQSSDSWVSLVKMGQNQCAFTICKFELLMDHSFS